MFIQLFVSFPIFTLSGFRVRHVVTESSTYDLCV